MKKFQPRKGFYIYGKNAVSETLANDPEKIVEVFLVQEKGKALKSVESLVLLAKTKNVPVRSIDEKKANKLIRGTELHMTQGVIAYYTGFSYATYEAFFEKHKDNDRSCVLVLDGVEDVQNFGAIVRSAVACGVNAIFVSDFHQAPVNGAVFKTSAGTINKIDIIQFAGMGQVMENLKRDEYWLYGIDMHDDADSAENDFPAGNIWQQKFDTRTALIIGGEHKGISQKAKAKCDFLAPIPMENGVESLNVSVASAVALYEWKRQQKN